MKFIKLSPMIIIVLICGCSHLKTSLQHPGTWVPLAGAAAIALADCDHSVSEWAMDNNPVFGSQKSADKKSDLSSNLAQYGMVISDLAVDGNRLKRLTTEYTGVYSARLIREPIKKGIDRKRPNSGSYSFPSGHCTKSFSYTAMTYRNIDEMNLSKKSEFIMKAITTGLSYSTAWARIEAGKHYPTDVLCGAALGNFISLLTYDMLMKKNCSITITPDKILFSKAF